MTDRNAEPPPLLKHTPTNEFVKRTADGATHETFLETFVDRFEGFATTKRDTPAADATDAPWSDTAAAAPSAAASAAHTTTATAAADEDSGKPSTAAAAADDEAPATAAAADITNTAAAPSEDEAPKRPWAHRRRRLDDIYGSHGAYMLTGSLSSSLMNLNINQDTEVDVTIGFEYTDTREPAMLTNLVFTLLDLDSWGGSAHEFVRYTPLWRLDPSTGRSDLLCRSASA